MADLDCSSFDSALETAAAVLGMSPGPLLDRLHTFDFSLVPESEWRQHPYDDLLVQHVTGVDRYALPAPERITWFHATRVPPSTDFAEGLLPLPSTYEDIERRLGRIKQELPPRSERQGSYPAWHSRGRNPQWKISSRFEKGPHAFLVRAMIFRYRELMHHDYLAIPEIVEDICSCYGDEYAPAVYEEYRKVTGPCIVVFRAPGVHRPETVGAALNYLHCVSRGMELSRACSACFDGEGIVPRDAIMRIERGEGLKAE